MEKSAIIEIAHISAIMSNHRTNELYEKARIGYIATTELIAQWAYEFYEKYNDFDWESLIDDTQTEFPKSCICWDDCIFYFVEQKVDNYV